MKKMSKNKRIMFLETLVSKYPDNMRRCWSAQVVLTLK